MDLKQLRAKLTTIDEQIIKLLEERFELVQEVWHLKEQKDLPYRSTKLEKEKIDYLSKSSKLPKELIEGIYSLIFNQNESYK